MHASAFSSGGLLFLRHVGAGVAREPSEMSSSAVRASFMYRLYSVGKPGGSSAAVLLGVGNSPSTRTLGILSARKEAISVCVCVSGRVPPQVTPQ